MIDPTNDAVHVFLDENSEWRWRRTDSENGKIVSTSGEGYSDRDYAIEAAAAYNAGLPITVDEVP